MAYASSSEAFTWHFAHSLDEKGRLTVPARWRFDGLKEFHCGPYRRRKDDGEVVPKLELLTEEERKSRVQQVQERSDFDAGTKKAIISRLNGDLAPCPMDSNNRILIPAEILERFGLSQELMLQGAERYIQVWNLKDYQAMQQTTDLDSLDELMAENGW